MTALASLQLCSIWRGCCCCPCSYCRQVHFRDVAVHRQAVAQRPNPIPQVQAQLQAVIEIHCHDCRIDYKGYSPGEIKKYATGKGNASKDVMLAAARERWRDIDVIDDNHADALWLLDLAEKEFGHPTLGASE